MHFFFSYARVDAADVYLHRFYDDLRRELATRAGIPHAETGFLDVEQPPGTLWSTATGKALAVSKVFVPVYSPSYFSSRYCGQEWHVFGERLAAHRRATGEAAAAIVPVWWVPLPADPPETARAIEDTRAKFGAEYLDYGLRYLMQLKENESRYQDFLVRFTIMIMAAAGEAPLPGAEVDLETQPDAFAGGPGRAPRPVSGPKRVTFVVAAGDRAQMRVMRATVDSYGDDWDDWRPYHPACPDPIALRAQAVATAQRMISALRPADDSLFQLLDHARARNELMVLLLDPWAVGLAGRRPVLEWLDGRRSGNIAVLVPWHAADPPDDTVRDRLYLSLGGWAEAGPPEYCDDIQSMEEFEKILAQVLVEIRARIVKRDEVARRVAGAAIPRPILAGPGG
ncbi:TIR-like protein FxsC [Sphaerisporangium sp. TRM90804]|uniref:TIR-like protein FxsC n=1 Tax=Sphaerisporangium sp. TRM90804 TaxID=3031113 RepID=UPI002448E5E3|nr:TIR-like protein FxsC [Sphaerisporangium sp. TRM90804]MDH2429382.1 TIR-like protein FxsC [Sphaerisporangium sp. TRM90804]